MATIATLGPQYSLAWQAARTYLPDAEIALFPAIEEVIDELENKRCDFAVIPIYNTREGEIRDVKVIKNLKKAFWIDNVVLPIHLSLGTIDDKADLTMIIGSSALLKQCQEYIIRHFPHADQMMVHDFEAALQDMKARNLTTWGIIETEEILRNNDLFIRQREVAPHNRTRFAVLGPEMTVPTGYDATALVTEPLADRVGILVDILSEFSRRGISIMDMHSENDVQTQKLQIYIEAEGHIDDAAVAQVVHRLEHNIIQERHCIKILGSYPRVDMRPKHIKKFGFIGTGDMSQWFAKKLQSEGYETLICGRSTALRPEAMIKEVDVVAVCVPISATAETVKTYGPLLRDGQALILLAGEAGTTIKAALESTSEGVEIMFVHNLWGPQAATMKDKNASVVKTQRSGSLCSEFEAFLYKHGADIYQDTADKHDLLMGVSQKLPTAISVALAMALKETAISTEDIESHATLTSLYAILAMARVHSQNPRTYAEIMATQGEGKKIVDSFVGNLSHIMKLAEAGKIDNLCRVIEESREYLAEDFLQSRMEQALAVDQTLGRIIRD